MARCVWCGTENVSGGRFCSMCGKEVTSAVIPGKCPKCGVNNALDMKRCGNCGEPLPEVKPVELPEAAPRRACRWCGKPASPGQEECWDCASRKHDSVTGVVTRSSSEGNLTIGAVLLIIAGVLALLQGILYMALGSLIVDLNVDASAYVSCCGLLGVLFGAGGIAGGYFAYRRENYVLALVGGIVATLGLGFVIGGLIGFVGTLLVWSEKEQF